MPRNHICESCNCKKVHLCRLGTIGKNFPFHVFSLAIKKIFSRYNLISRKLIVSFLLFLAHFRDCENIYHSSKLGKNR